MRQKYLELYHQVRRKRGRVLSNWEERLGGALKFLMRICEMKWGSARGQGCNVMMGWYLASPSQNSKTNEVHIPGASHSAISNSYRAVPWWPPTTSPFPPQTPRLSSLHLRPHSLILHRIVPPPFRFILALNKSAFLSGASRNIISKSPDSSTLALPLDTLIPWPNSNTYIFTQIR